MLGLKKSQFSISRDLKGAKTVESKLGLYHGIKRKRGFGNREGLGFRKAGCVGQSYQSCSITLLVGREDSGRAGSGYCGLDY